MIDMTEIGAARRRGISVMAAVAAVGMVSIPHLVRAQGPDLPPPPPNLEIPAAPGGGNAGGGAAAAPAPGGGMMNNGGQAPQVATPQGMIAEATLPVVLQGDVKSIQGDVITLSVKSGADVSTRKVNVADATYANSNGTKVDKFVVKAGDAVIVVTEALTAEDAANTAQSFKAVVVEKNVVASAKKTAK